MGRGQTSVGNHRKYLDDRHGGADTRLDCPVFRAVQALDETLGRVRL